MANIFQCDNCGVIDAATDQPEGYVRRVSCRVIVRDRDKCDQFLCAICYDAVSLAMDKALSIAADTA